MSYVIGEELLEVKAMASTSRSHNQIHFLFVESQGHLLVAFFRDSVIKLRFSLHKHFQLSLMGREIEIGKGWKDEMSKTDQVSQFGK